MEEFRTDVRVYYFQYLWGDWHVLACESAEEGEEGEDREERLESRFRDWTSALLAW